MESPLVLVINGKKAAKELKEIIRNLSYSTLLSLFTNNKICKCYRHDKRQCIGLLRTAIRFVDHIMQLSQRIFKLDEYHFKIAVRLPSFSFKEFAIRISHVLQFFKESFNCKELRD